MQTHGSGSRAAREVMMPRFGPHPGERALLADPRLILKPDLERFAPRGIGDRRSYRLGKVFLNASWASGSVFG